MDAVEFLKALGRLCNNYLCRDNCPLIDSCDDESDDGYVRKVQIVEQWAKEHPVKTRKDEFFISGLMLRLVMMDCRLLLHAS